MSSNQLHSIVAADLAGAAPLRDAILALNNAHAEELSWLEPARLTHLVEQAFVAKRVGEVDAFLLAFDHASDYDSPNFLWFRERYARFVYVDRIVVSAQARGRGLARRLYEDLFTEAARAGHQRVVCEVNATPPNPASDAFHAKLNFAEVGSAALYAGNTVRYFCRAL